MRNTQEKMMKTTTLLIAAMLMPAANGFCHHAPKLDFDKGALQPAEFLTQAGGTAVPAPAPLCPDGEVCGAALPGEENIGTKGSVEWEKSLDDSIRSGIAFSIKNDMDLVHQNLKRLLARGNLQEKAAFVYNPKSAYRFPERFARSADEGGYHVAIGNCQRECVSWSTRSVCLNRQVCKLVCVVGGAVGGTAGSAGAAYICTEVCETIPECTDVQTCSQWKLSNCW